ncbi:MAG: hypothetical protein U0166_05540 [Acidobacteriota bacterium]
MQAMTNILSSAALALCVPVVASSGSVSGTFRDKGVTYKVVDAFAIETAPVMGDENVYQVRLSDHPLDHKALDATLDWKSELDAQEGQGFVDLYFSKDGAYSAASYGVGSAGCGLCSDGKAAEKSHVKVEGGSLKGTMKIQPADYMDGEGPAIDLVLDVPISVQSGVIQLGADGGEIGKTFLDCRAAFAKKDLEGVRSGCFSPEDAKELVPEQEEDAERFWELGPYGKDSIVQQGLTISGGRVKGDWGELFVRLKSPEGGRQEGSVFFRKGPRGWRYRSEDLHGVY